MRKGIRKTFGIMLCLFALVFASGCVTNAKTASMRRQLADEGIADLKTAHAEILAAGKIEVAAEAIHDASARESEAFQIAHHPKLGDFETVSPPLRMSGLSLRSERVAPALGADNESLLKEAGLDEEAIRALLKAD